MTTRDDEEAQLRSVALQNAHAVLLARQRAEAELVRAKDALEHKTRALAHTLAMMRATLEATTDGILVTDEHGTITDYNEMYPTLWRLPREIVDSREHSRVLDAISQGFRDPAAFQARVREIVASGQETYDVLELADGRVFERFSSIQRADGRNVGRVWSVRDITDQRRAEDALRDESHMLELLNKTGELLSSTLDLQQLLQAVTDAGREASGAAFGAFFYKTTDDKGAAYRLYSLSGARREAWEPRATLLFARTFKGETAIRCDDVLKDPRFGQTGHLPVRSYLAVPVVSRSGDVIGGLLFGHPEPGVFTKRAEQLVVGIASQAAIAIDNAHLYAAAQTAADERKRLLDSERLARADAERASAMKDEFLATLSHELRTPLNAILGWSKILCMPGVSPVDFRRGLEVVERNARIQAQLIEDLLDMSRITSGKIALEIRAVSLPVVIEAALETVRPVAQTKGVQLTSVMDDGSSGLVAGDPNRLQQVVWNLLSNAIKFTEKGGRVHVTLRHVDSRFEIAVVDTGVGIAPEFLPYVFDRFRQADASNTRAAGGLGLGLAIVKHLVELHGGTVRAESAGRGAGTTFTIELPVVGNVVDGDAGSQRRRPEMAATAPEFRRMDLTGVRVLVVDDNEDARMLIQRMLEGCGASVTTAATVAQTLLAVEHARPHVLVSDVAMPEVDGYELLRRVRALGQSRGGGVPAIALTAFARSEDRTRALRAGFLHHIAKPIEPAEVVATVASVVGRTSAPLRE